MGNRVYGLGSSVVPSYGLYLNASFMNPSIIADNVVSGFSYGMYGPYGACNFHDNVFFDVKEPVVNAVSGDLGRDAPSTIPSTVTTYWRRGQFVENVYPTSSPTILGWKCVGPASGLGCTYSNAVTTGDMISGQATITNVAAIGRYIPGVAITLANAASGPATLETEVVSWKIGYSLSSGSASFQDGEVVEGRTSHAFATVGAGTGSGSMNVICVHQWRQPFAVGETIVGHQSGATAEVTAMALEVADVCGDTVNGETLSLVVPTWATILAVQ